MKLTDKELKVLKTKLALKGSGSKKELAELINCKQSQLSYILATGLVSKNLSKGIIDFINSK